MKVFTCTDFEGYYPIGTAAVVLAEDEQQARTLLAEELHRRDLNIGNAILEEVDATKAAAHILRDGYY